MSAAHVLKADQFYGKGIEGLFPEGSFERRGAPWEEASKFRHTGDYDQSIVNDALRRPPQLQEIDPRDLHRTQPHIVKGGVDHYLTGEYEKTGETYEMGEKLGNRFPFVYRREAATEGYDPQPQNLILAGHHRAAAALAKGQPLRAIIVRGPWGQTR